MIVYSALCCSALASHNTCSQPTIHCTFSIVLFCFSITQHMFAAHHSLYIQHCVVLL
jgi:hypothetical protein